MNVHLDPQHGKVEHQIHLPQYFVLIDIGVQTWLGYPLKVLGIHSKDSQIHLFLHLSHDMSYISPFFLMSNEIILFIFDIGI